MPLHKAQIALRKHASLKNKKTCEWFFKTGPGEYGYGDQFIGVKIPEIRSVVKKFQDLTLKEIQQLITSPIHEDRMLGLKIVRAQYEKAAKLSPQALSKLFNFVWKYKKHINNWDLVDCFVPYVFGHYAFHNPLARKKIFALVKSKSLWDRRIAIMTTYYFIRQKEFGHTLDLSKKLLGDKEDLMHKASGWMLREVGNRDLPTLLNFLDVYTLKMPRTMLRYAIEKLPEKQRLAYLKK